jgi:putative methyltransferase (TIGR04325 family)
MPLPLTVHVPAAPGAAPTLALAWALALIATADAPAPLLRRLVENPLVRRIRQVRYDRYFEAAPAGFPFRGVYPTFAAAAAAAPRSKPNSYDVDEAALVHVAEASRMAPSDYPMVYWLKPLLSDAAVVFDFGGHVGTKYRAFRDYVAYPSGLRWLVCDVPSVARAGERLARSQQLRQLAFTTDFAEVEGATVLIASGSLQYTEQPLWERLARVRRPPHHVLINKLPVRDGGGFVTVQSLGVAFVPYVVFDRAQLLAGMAARSYELVDEWDVPDRPAAIPFHPELDVRHVGMYLRHRGAEGNGDHRRA